MILEPSCIASTVENSALENSLTVPQRVLHRFTIWSSKSGPKCMHREKKEDQMNKILNERGDFTNDTTEM